MAEHDYPPDMVRMAEELDEVLDLGGANGTRAINLCLLTSFLTAAYETGRHDAMVEVVLLARQKGWIK